LIKKDQNRKKSSASLQRNPKSEISRRERRERWIDDEAAGMASGYVPMTMRTLEVATDPAVGFGWSGSSGAMDRSGGVTGRWGFFYLCEEVLVSFMYATLVGW
jgi:hypothetical protein